MCAEPRNNFDDKDINGECPDCGAATVDGEAFDQCAHSTVICKTCNSAPCDQSC